MGKNKNDIQSVKGMHDVLPEEQLLWDYFTKKAKTLLDDYGFGHIVTPIVEQTALFQRSVGESTDIVEKEMYSFKTKGGDQLSLRPEFTAGIVRAYIEHGMHVRPHPIQLWTMGPLFRHENPQAGRTRQHSQLDVEMFGDDTPAADAQLIFIAYKLLDSLGLKNLTVQINSIGDQNCRPQYVKALKEYYRGRDKKLCATCQKRVKTSPLRLLDCKVETCKEIAKDAPQMLDYLDEECKKHFKGVLEFLDEISVPYMLDHTLVRGLDYYTRTLFEVVQEQATDEASESKETKKLALAGGGRYDKLVEFLGGPKTPATGWGMGVERAILAMRQSNVKLPEKSQPKIYIAQLGELAKRKSLILFEEFRKAGIATKASFGRDNIKSQLRIANKLGMLYTLIMGQKEALDSSVIVREMKSGVQETIPMEKAVEALKHKLKNK